MHDHRRRLERLAWQHIRQLAAEAGQPFGFTADDILEEARRIFALPEAAQRRERHWVSNELTPEEARELDDGWARDVRIGLCRYLAMIRRTRAAHDTGQKP